MSDIAVKFDHVVAKDEATAGYKVRKTNWAKDTYVVYDQNRGYIWNDFTPCTDVIFYSSSSTSEWEYFNLEDEIREVSKAEPAKLTTEDEFWATSTNSNLGNSTCDCGGKYVDDRHSDWCSSKKYQYSYQGLQITCRVS